MKVNLTYFKASGKYYSSGSYNSDKEHMIDIVQEVKLMHDIRQLPDLCINHSDYNIHILPEFSGYPHLLINLKE